MCIVALKVTFPVTSRRWLMNKETTLLLFYSNESQDPVSQMFPFYSKTQLRSIESANRSREIYREDEAKLFVVFTFAGEHESPDVRARVTAIFFPRTRKIHDCYSIQRWQTIYFPIILQRQPQIRDFIAVITCKRPSSLRRIPHFGRDEILQRAKTLCDFMDGASERSSIFHLEAKRGAVHFLLLSIFLFSSC